MTIGDKRYIKEQDGSYAVEVQIDEHEGQPVWAPFMALDAATGGVDFSAVEDLLQQIENATDGLEAAASTTNTRLADLSGYTDTLEALVTTLNTHIDGLETLITASNASLVTVAGGVDGLEALVTTLNGYVDGLEALIGTTNTNLTTVAGHVDGLEALITTLNGLVDGLEGLLGGTGQINTRTISGRLTDPNAGETLTQKTANGVATASGDNVVLAAVAGKKIRVLAYALQVQEAGTRVTARFQDTATATNRTMPWMLYMSADDTAIHGVVRNPGSGSHFYFDTGDGVGLDLNLSGAIDVGWEITYVEVE